MKTREVLFLFSLIFMVTPALGAGDIAQFGDSVPQTVESGSETELELKFDLDSARKSGSAMGEQVVLQEIELKTGSDSEVLISDGSGIEKDRKEGNYNIYVEKSDFSKLGTGTKDIQAKFTLDYRNFNNPDTYLTETKQIEIQDDSENQNSEQTYSLSLETDGSGLIRGDNERVYSEGEQISLEAVPAQGYSFRTFNGVNCNTKTCSFSISNDMTVEAVFEADSSDQDDEENEQTSGLPESADPSYGPSDGYLVSGDEEIRRIEWREPSHEDTTLEINIDGNGKNVRLSCSHRWLGDLGQQTKKVDGKTTFLCEIPSLFHREVETINLELCDTDTGNCRQIDKRLAFGPVEERSSGEIAIRRVEHPDSTTGNLPVEIYTNGVSADKAIFDFGDYQLEKTSFEQEYGRVKTEIPEENISQGKNEFNVTLEGQEEKDSSETSTFFLLNDVDPELKFSSLRINSGFYRGNTLNGEINVENPLKSVYLHKITVNVTYNGEMWELADLGDLYPQESKKFEFDTQIPFETTNNSTVRMYYRNDKVAEKDFNVRNREQKADRNVSVSTSASTEQKNLEKRKEEIEKMIAALSEKDLDTDMKQNLSRLEEKYETFKGLEVEDKELADRYTRIYNEIKEVNSSKAGEESGDSITGNVASSPSSILNSTYTVPAVIVSAAIVILFIAGIRYRRSSKDIPLPEPVETRKNKVVQKMRALLSPYVESISEESEEDEKEEGEEDDEEEDVLWGLP